MRPYSSPCSRPPRSALRSRPLRVVCSLRSLPFTLLFHVHIHRDLSGNQISGTVPNAFGQLKNLDYLCVPSSSPHFALALRRPAACSRPPRTVLRSLPSRVVRSPLSPLRRYLHDNQITGVGAGICAVKDRLSQCQLPPNPAWTNGAMCPACLNSGRCKPPVTCTGPNTPPTP